MARRVIQIGEHVLVAGRTGSGKTYLARKYLAWFPARVVALDTKGTLQWTEVPQQDLQLVRTLEQLKRARARRVIYRPNWDEMTPEGYDEFFWWCYAHGGPLVVWVDEAMSVCPSPFQMPEYYRAILTRGRELGVSAWSLTQRPTGIPQVILSESTHFFVFDLRLKQDREKLVFVTGAEELYELPGKYRFWYYHVEDDRAILAQLREGG